MSDFSSDFEEMRKELKVCYRKEFLLSLSELDSCKKLPSEFDSSISRELSDTCAGLLQACDSESSSLDRSGQCMWQNGLLGKGYCPREAGGIVGASPSELQSMRQNPEIGLLGKGSFPRKPECIVGVSASEVQSSGFHLLSRSATPYRPPHLSKANLLSQVEIRDINDGKTLGSTDFTSFEKAEEQSRIRDSFELMTKGENAFQEREHEQKEDLYPGIITLLGDFANDEKRFENAANLEDTSVHDLDEKSDEVDEICLPDEDSLITVEDFIVPKDLLLMPDRDWSSTEFASFSSTTVENFRKLAVLNPSSDNRKSKPSMENLYVNPNAGQLNPHFYQPHADLARNRFYSQSQTAAGRSEAQSLNTKFSYLAPDLALSTTLQSGAWQNFYDPFMHPSQRQIQAPGGFPITHRTAPNQTKNSISSFGQANFLRL